ncbi:MAG TPA: hypothetical protein VJH23_05840 [archaeon]|nr:hypothetical protein [archaeon]
MKTIAISRKETKNPKRKKELPDVITQLERSLEDIKNGRIREAIH